MKRFDMRDAIIPFSLLQATNYFQKMQSGDIMEIICNDKEPIADLQSILPAGRFHASVSLHRCDGQTGYRLVLQKQ